ncbi:Uncharacterized protein FKW44_003107, partial [Caligus rogercresseyi]
ILLGHQLSKEKSSVPPTEDNETRGFPKTRPDHSSEAVELYGDAVELCLKASPSAEQRKLRHPKEKIKNNESLSFYSPSTQIPSLPPLLGLLNLQERIMSTMPQEQGAWLLRGRETCPCYNYVPFMRVDNKERFAFPLPYTDPLATEHLHQAKINDFMKEPKISNLWTAIALNKPLSRTAPFWPPLPWLLTSHNLHHLPQNRKGDPVYNPCGKYMVRLRVNGVSRKVVIDDYLPLGNNNELICSYSSNRNELWVSLLEKAYMKVMGGYDFQGLTVILTSMLSRDGSLSDKAFKKIYDRFHKGDVLVTFGTGDIGEFSAERAGLVPKHAYAMLDIREVNVIPGLIFVGEETTLSWTAKTLNYNPESAAQFDNGVFWIDLDSVVEFFEVIYMNWNPGSSNLAIPFIPDMFFFSNNPQYSLELTAPGAGAFWILLSIHITDIEDFKDNKEYIALMSVIKEDTDRKFTLVVSQFEKTATIYYSVPEATGTLLQVQEGNQNGEWKESQPEAVPLGRLKGPKQYFIGFDIMSVVVANSSSPKFFNIKQSGAFRPAFAVLSLELLAGTYDIIPCTFKPKQEGPFFLTVQCT